ncbi:MAG TPA: hypothetical protein VLB03_11585 [Nocardioidaceae bacterium]|nr:hypothetical protein [Nocardioidaceae bacterium]
MAWAPVVSLVVLALLVVLLRWTYSRGGSLVARPGRPGPARDYGLLVAIASPSTYIEGELARRRLEDAGLRATLAHTTEGPRLMVFAEDEARARALLAGRS